MTRSSPAWSALTAALALTAIGACVIAPANVGETAMGTDSDDADGDDDDDDDDGITSTGGADDDDDDGPDDDDDDDVPDDDDDDDVPDDDDDDDAGPCSTDGLTACASARVVLVEDALVAVPALIAEAEAHREALAVVLGVPGIDGAEALDASLEIAGIDTFDAFLPRCTGTIGGALAMLDTCDPGHDAQGFGCQGRCDITEAQFETCLEEGTIACVTFGGACNGICNGTCDLMEAPGACDGDCLGACSGTCSCGVDPGLCFGTCDGECGGWCATEGACATACTGECELSEVPGPETACLEDDFQCHEAGPGTCLAHCDGVVTPAAGIASCCEPIVGLAGALATECLPATVNLTGGPQCSANTDENEPIGDQLGTLAAVQRRMELLLGELDVAIADLASVPRELPTAGCDEAAWQSLAADLAVSRDALEGAKADLDDLLETLAS